MGPGMARRVAWRLLPLLAVAAAVAVALPLLGRLWRTGEHAAPPAQDFGPPAWPQAGYSPDLRGLAPGELPPALRLRWQFKTGDAVKSSPAIVDGVVYIGGDDQHLYAIGLADGLLRWKFPAGQSVPCPPLVHEGRVYFGCAGGRFFCLDLAGRQVWTFSAGNDVVGPPNWLKLPDGRTLILLGSYDHTLYALDARTGLPAWTREADDYINGGPAVLGGRIAFGSCDGKVRVLAPDGRQAAVVDAAAYVPASPALADDEVYFGQFEKTVWCAGVDGQVRWKHAAGDEARFMAPPAVGDQLVIIGARDKRLHALARSDGSEAWSFDGHGSFDAQAVICGQTVLAADDQGWLYMLDADSGRQRWSYEIGAALSAGPAVAAGAVVIGCQDGNVYCFEAQVAAPKR